MTHRSLLLLFFFLSSVAIRAQTVSDLSTDRPDQTESAETVPHGWLQVEAGLVYERAASAGAGLDAPETWTLPTVLLRYGIHTDFEIRLGTAWMLEQRTDEGGGTRAAQSGDAGELPRKSVVERGSEPLAIGCKYQFGEAGPLRIAGILMFALPSTVAGDFPANNPALELRLAAAADMSEWISAGMNLALERDLEEDRTGIHYTAVLGAAITDWLGGFIEFYGSMDSGETEFRHRFDSGLTWLVTPDLQVDTSAGIELNETGIGRGGERGYFAGAGISYRVPFPTD